LAAQLVGIIQLELLIAIVGDWKLLLLLSLLSLGISRFVLAALRAMGSNVP
jgi:hypothetical protein